MGLERSTQGDLSRLCWFRGCNDVVSSLPSGTVSLLFSDIEGSTALLLRLGALYADALDGQRRVLRKAWNAHGGTELGTEGDSFYVVFPTADGAVAAAVEGQRELAQYPWPGGERLRVRMGMHTGSPRVHDGGYVGIDVVRAARIAASAHGGQVVVSSATEGLVRGGLPSGVSLRDLGTHQVKDIDVPERLFQLAIDGLPSAFPALKTLGASSSLPVPASPLVGRCRELAELTAVLSSPEVRLVTLTGPGGSGKTRLAIAIANQLVSRFPDGIYFVPLAAVTTVATMWTTIAEVLDLPPECRITPGFFESVAHRSALLVLDNLEQLTDADAVVARLLEAAPQIVVLATSRRRLNVPGERQHAVSPLELPDAETVAEAEGSGAVQLFVQQARGFKADFSLTAENVADITAICRRLDGLPLAIQLAAARIRLLGPAAVLGRLDQALDIAASSRLGPRRQRTLRDTIAWSYDLLSARQQTVFRRLGVFAGGAELDAVSAVATDIFDGEDPLGLVTELVDASLITVAEGVGGEPRVGMLETVRAFALAQLDAVSELDGVRLSHAKHYLAVIEELRVQVLSGVGHQLLETRQKFELEHDNVRDALTWALGCVDPGTSLSPNDPRLGMNLCASLWTLWVDGGPYSEARLWLERAVSLGDEDSPELGCCLGALSAFLLRQGGLAEACDLAERSVAMLRRVGDRDKLCGALIGLGGAQDELGDLPSARRSYEEALALASQIDDEHDNKLRQASTLNRLGVLEISDGNFEKALKLFDAAIGIRHEIGDEYAVLVGRHNAACTLHFMGQPQEAYRRMSEQIPDLLRLARPDMLIILAEDYAAVLIDLGDHKRAVRLLGAAEAMRERHGTPRERSQATDIEKRFANARAALAPGVWDHEYQLGHALTVEDALTEAYAASTACD